MTSEREALRAKNSEPSALEREALGSGDASLKKNTSYLKRIRTALAQSDQTEGLVKDISHLRLDKYLEELVQAVSEASLRVKVGTEVQAAAKVISALHQHFGHDAFTAPLVAALTAQCKLPVVTSKNVPQDQRDKEESARVSRQRALLRLLAELDVVGLIKTDKIQPGQVTWQLLQDLLLATDKDLLLAHASIALAITKHCAFLLPPLDQSASVQASTALVHPDIQAKFLALLQTFYNHLSNRAVKDRLLLLTQEKSNNEAYIRSGELFEDRKANFDRLVARWDKMWASVQSLAEVLHLQMPELPQAQSVPTSSSLVVSAAAHVTGPQPDGSVWDPRFVDEEEMRFYKDLKDLHVGDNHVQVVSTIPQEEAPSSAHEDQLELESSAAQDAETVAPQATDLPTAPAEPEGEALPAGPAARLSDLLTRLPDMSSQSFIDNAALEFIPLNSKAARNRLVKFLHDTPATRLDLLPFYTRFVANLRPLAPEIASGLLASLESDFRYLQKRKNVELRDLRRKTMVYIAELAKFDLVPPHAILHSFKVLVDDLTHFNVDSFSVMLESCGRYVFRNEPTHEKMATILEIFLRKKSAQNLDARQVNMLESAYYQVNPPERAAIVRREKSPMEQFLHHILHRMLSRSNYVKCLLLLRKMDWQDTEIRHPLFNAFTKVWKAKFSSIPLFALLVYDLGKFHPEFAITVADRVLENIRLGLERNNFKHNQRRVASIKYLGELYNFQTVDAKVILDCLWILVTFGHPDGQPHPDRPSALDDPNDWFRVRLVCVLLDAVYTYLDRGHNRARLDNFLTFFQLYINCKSQPAPMDIDFLLSDTIETVRPKLTMAKSFDESAQAVHSMLSANATGPSVLEEPEEEEDDRSDASSVRNMSPSSSSDEADEAETRQDEGSSDDEVKLSPAKRPGMSEEEEADFARDLAKMMSGTGTNKSLNARANLDVGLPMLKRDGASIAADENHMTFNLLTKKGAKAQVKTFEIPTEVAIASRSREQQQQRVLEQQQLKQLVLQSERRQQSSQEEDETADLEATLARRGFRLKTKA